MLAVDTNILVRFFTHDDLRQTARALATMRNEVWVSKTVILETEWVLRRAYRLDPERVREAFGQLLGMDNVQIEQPLIVAQALDWFGAGLDLADALHVASSGEAERFATFDQKLAKRAKNRTTIEVVAI